MTIKRKWFAYPEYEADQRTEVVQQTVGIFREKLVPKTVIVPRTKDEVIEQVRAFVDQIGPERLVNICEHTQSIEWRGDDGRRIWIIWYWDDTPSES